MGFPRFLVLLLQRKIFVCKTWALSGFVGMNFFDDFSDFYEPNHRRLALAVLLDI